MALFKKKKKPRTVPELVLLPRERDDNLTPRLTPSPSPTSAGVSSRSVPIGLRDVPRCPTCRDESGMYVRKFRYWIAKDMWVWHCSHEIKNPYGHGSTFCGTLFCEDRPRPTCEDCGKPVRLRVGRNSPLEDTFEYVCQMCKNVDARVTGPLQ